MFSHVPTFSTFWFQWVSFRRLWRGPRVALGVFWALLWALGALLEVYMGAEWTFLDSLRLGSVPPKFFLVFILAYDKLRWVPPAHFWLPQTGFLEHQSTVFCASSCRICVVPIGCSVTVLVASFLGTTLNFLFAWSAEGAKREHTLSSCLKKVSSLASGPELLKKMVAKLESSDISYFLIWRRDHEL